jgi:hypothetical protein
VSDTFIGSLTQAATQREPSIVRAPGAQHKVHRVPTLLACPSWGRLEVAKPGRRRLVKKGMPVQIQQHWMRFGSSEMNQYTRANWIERQPGHRASPFRTRQHDVEDRISCQRRLHALYMRLPEGKRAGIEARDQRVAKRAADSHKSRPLRSQLSAVRCGGNCRGVAPATSRASPSLRR